jgi:hypothetical protein
MVLTVHAIAPIAAFWTGGPVGPFEAFAGGLAVLQLRRLEEGEGEALAILPQHVEGELACRLDHSKAPEQATL